MPSRSHRWRRVEEVFDAVVDLPAAARTAALDREASGDPALRAEVEALLQAERAAGVFFQNLGRALPGSEAASGEAHRR